MSQKNKYNIFVKAGFKETQQRDESGKWSSGPTGEFQADELEYYTFSDSDANSLNDCLRDPKCKDEFLKNRAKAINDSLTHLDSYDRLTFRGISFNEQEYDDFMAQVKGHEEINFKAFISSSPDPDVVTSFAMMDKKAIVFELDGKTGKDISKYSVYGSDEEEILFGSGTNWKIKEVREDLKWLENRANGRRKLYTYITLEEI